MSQHNSRIFWKRQFQIASFYLIGYRCHGIIVFRRIHDLRHLTGRRYPGSTHANLHTSCITIVIYYNDKLLCPVKSRIAEDISISAQKLDRTGAKCRIFPMNPNHIPMKTDQSFIFFSPRIRSASSFAVEVISSASTAAFSSASLRRASTSICTVFA